MSLLPALGSPKISGELSRDFSQPEEFLFLTVQARIPGICGCNGSLGFGSDPGSLYQLPLEAQLVLGTSLREESTPISLLCLC